MENISVILVDINTIYETIRFLDDYRKVHISGMEVHAIIVDNCIGSEADAILGKHFSYKENCCIRISHNAADINVKIFERDLNKIVYYYAGENLGYARGNNVGTEIADVIFNDNFYLISNNDIFFNGEIPWMKIFELFNSDESIAIIGPKVVDTKGNPQSPSIKMPDKYWLFYKPWHSLLFSGIKRTKSDVDYNGVSKKVYRVMGSFMIVRREPFVKINRFDDETFLYFEELILAEKLKRIGKVFYFYNDYCVSHIHGFTTSKFRKRKGSYRMFIDAEFSSAIYYCEKYLGTNKNKILLAKVNYYFRLPLYRIKEHLKGLIRPLIKRQ